MRGKYKKKQGKITEVKIKSGKIYIEGIQIKKQDGSKANVPIKASNLQIISLNLEDKKRSAKIERRKIGDGINEKIQGEQSKNKTRSKKWAI